MSMILELTEDYVMQEYFEDGKLRGPLLLHQGLRGILQEAGPAAGINGIEDATAIAVIQIINDDAEFELVAVPLTQLKIAFDNSCDIVPEVSSFGC